MLEGAKKDVAHVSPDWVFKVDAIDGLKTKEVRNILTKNGVTREIYRPDWGIAAGQVQHMIHVNLRAHAISAWHMHEIQTDHIFAVRGAGRMALYDDRADSPTKGKVNVFQLNPMRPTLYAIPPGVWHGLQNTATPEFEFINFFNHPYNYEQPDEWRLPWNTDQIPYAFER